MNQRKLVTNYNTPWLCLKDPNSNLVYFVHSKCASTFYRTFFSQLNWVEWSTKDIDWENDVIFSHIRDPLKKHRVGIIEWFYFNHCEKLLEINYDNDDFFRMLSEIIYIDVHSMSIYEHLEEKSFRVKWIPIDAEKRDHLKETADLIEIHNSKLKNFRPLLLSSVPENVSAGFKKTCVDKLMNIKPTPLLIKSLEQDRYLYDLTVSLDNFEPTNYGLRIKQLCKTGISQMQAEKIADGEVLYNEHLNWQFK
jgi:hypothetical protein